MFNMSDICYREQLDDDVSMEVWKCLGEILETKKASFFGFVVLRQSASQVSIGFMKTNDIKTKLIQFFLQVYKYIACK